MTFFKRFSHLHFFSLFSRWIIKPLGILTLLFLIVTTPMMLLSKNFLLVEKPMQKADWIVVLGGESSQRVIKAAELYHEGKAPLIFVSGNGDCHLIIKRLAMAGVPRSNISYECRSSNTRGNALETKSILRSKSKNVILVTSWYHTHRALSTFEHIWPEVDFGIYAAYPGTTVKDYPTAYESGFILSEYLKWLKFKLGY